MQTAFRNGLVRESDVIEIGSVISGDVVGRRSEEEITVFDSTGMALQDIVTANLALVRAIERGIGSLVTIVTEEGGIPLCSQRPEMKDVLGAARFLEGKDQENPC
jgi:hypothetical protein